MQVMKDSKLPLDWIVQACTQNPIKRLTDDAGQPTQNYSTGPVRLSWTQWLAKPQKTNRASTSGRAHCCSRQVSISRRS
jgi:hypothetical protein